MISRGSSFFITSSFHFTTLKRLSLYSCLNLQVSKKLVVPSKILAFFSIVWQMIHILSDLLLSSLYSLHSSFKLTKALMFLYKNIHLSSNSCASNPLLQLHRWVTDTGTRLAISSINSSSSSRNKNTSIFY